MPLAALLACHFSEPGPVPGEQALAVPGVAAVRGMLHPRVPLPGDWATGGCPLVAPAPWGSPGDIPRDPVCPSRQMAASLVSTINPAAGRWKAKGRQQGKASRCPSPSTGGNMGFGGETARSPSPACRLSRHPSTELKQQKESQIPTTAEERGVCSYQRWSRRAPALPSPQLPEALPLPTQSTHTQNTRSGFSLAAVHKTPITATFPPSQGFQLSRCGSKQSGAGRAGAQPQNAGMPAGS